MTAIKNLVSRFYDIVNGEGEFSEVLSEDFQFGIMKGFPYGGNKDGLSETIAFFESFGPLCESFEVHPVDFIQQDDNHLIVRGFYRARAAATGTEVDFETVHFWTSNGEKLNSYKHYCDTGLLCAALGESAPTGLLP